MTVATSEDLLRSILEGIPEVGIVHDRIRSRNERADAEFDIMADDLINVWEFQVDTETLHDGASGLNRAEGVVTILAHYFHSDSSNSRGEFRDVLKSVADALVIPETGFAAMKSPGVTLTERPTRPMHLRTGHSAYRAQLDFRTWDLTST